MYAVPVENPDTFWQAVAASVALATAVSTGIAWAVGTWARNRSRAEADWVLNVHADFITHDAYNSDGADGDFEVRGTFANAGDANAFRLTLGVSSGKGGLTMLTNTIFGPQSHEWSAIMEPGNSGQVPVLLRPGAVSAPDLRRVHTAGAVPGPLHPPAARCPGLGRDQLRPGRRRDGGGARGLMAAGPGRAQPCGHPAAGRGQAPAADAGHRRTRFRSVRFFNDPQANQWKRYEPWMTTIVDLNTGQVLGIVDGRDSRGVGTNRLWRTVNRWWKEIEVLIVTGATTAKVEANNTAIKHIKRTGRGFVNSWNYSTRVMLRSAAKTTAC